MKRSSIVKKVVSPVLAIALSLSFYGTALADTTSTSSNQKEDYYEQYLEIASEVSELTGRQIDVLPISELEESDWVAPSEFKERALEFANYEIKILPEESNELTITPFSTGDPTKKATITVNNLSAVIEISGKFTTQYSSFHDRQLFSGVTDIKSKLSSSSSGKWTHIDGDKTVLDGGRTYQITVLGTYERLGMSSNVYATVEFSCSATGKVS